MKSASWAVVKTSGTPPAAVPVELLRDRHRRALVDDRELGLAAAGRRSPSRGRRARSAATPAAALDDLAGQLEAGDVLRRAGRRRIAAA